MLSVCLMRFKIVLEVYHQRFLYKFYSEIGVKCFPLDSQRNNGVSL